MCRHLVSLAPLVLLVACSGEAPSGNATGSLHTSSGETVELVGALATSFEPGFVSVVLSDHELLCEDFWLAEGGTTLTIVNALSDAPLVYVTENGSRESVSHGAEATDVDIAPFGDGAAGRFTLSQDGEGATISFEAPFCDLF